MGDHSLPDPGLLERLRDLVPASTRRWLHIVAPALVTLIAAYGFTTEDRAALIGAAIVAVGDLGLAMLHSESTWRTLVYPALAAVAAVCVGFGIVEQDLATATLGVIAAVLGSALAAGYTPTGHVARFVAG